jgi:hypothetical protein
MQLRKLSELEQRMTADADWAEHSPDIMQNPEYYGKFVVVYNKQVLAAGRDRQPLVEQAAKEAGVPWRHLVVVVVPDPRTEAWEVPIEGEGVMQLQVRKMSELEQRMTADADWAEHAPEVMQNPEYFGKLVVVHNTRVIAAGDERQALVEQAAKAVGVPRQHLVVVLVPDPEMWEIPH